MPAVHPAFYSLLTFIVALAASATLYFMGKRYPGTLLFRERYAVAFAIFAFVTIPIIAVNFDVPISRTALLTFYCISFVAALFSYLLFLTASARLFTRERFFSETFPLVYVPSLAALLTILMFALHVDELIIYTALIWAFYFPIDMFLITLFCRFFVKGEPHHPVPYRTYHLLSAIGWLSLLATDISLWWMAVTYPYPEFWLLKIAGADGWYLFRSAAYVLIAAGALRYSNHSSD